MKTFNPNLPYKVFEVNDHGGIFYIIKQPLNLWIFGNTAKYYPIQKRIGMPYTMAVLRRFADKNEVDLFVAKGKTGYRETVVFDSNYPTQ